MTSMCGNLFITVFRSQTITSSCISTKWVWRSLRQAETHSQNLNNIEALPFSKVSISTPDQQFGVSSKADDTLSFIREC